MKYLLIWSVLFCCACLSNTVDAQTPGTKPSAKAQVGKIANDSSSTEPDEQPVMRRAFASQVVISLADEARTYKDESLRATVQSRAGDVLWNIDETQARALFKRAWEAAETVDREGKRRNEEEQKKSLSGRGGTGLIAGPPNVRAQVLRFISIHDGALTESFVKRMEDENKREEEEKGSKPWDPTEPPEALTKRLELARTLLMDGETEKALRFAGEGLNRVTSQGIIFLVMLRQKNEAQADSLFAAMLQKAATDPMADATAASFLASYVFTPATLVSVTRSGLQMKQWTETLPAPNLSPSLRVAFFRVAAQLLLRSDAELERTSTGRAGTHFAIMRLLPLFSEFDPDVSALLRSRLSSLGQGTGQMITEQQRKFADAGFTEKETAKRNEEEDILSRIERASTTSERDHLYAIAAQAALKKDDPMVLEFADKVESTELRRNVRGFVYFILISKALEKKDSETAIQLARAGELSAFQRTWVYTEAAILRNKSEPERAQELIRDAVAEAKRIDPSSSETPQAWIAIARRLAEIDRMRTWEMLPEVVKAANRVVGYVGQENMITVSLRYQNSISVENIPAPSVNLANLFQVLAKEDFPQAVDMARGITSESARAAALLAAVRTELKSEPMKRQSMKSQ